MPDLRTSVLINNYNNGSFLEHCLESVFSQDLPPTEVIVYDDGSTDQSRAILSRYESRLTLIARPHGPGTPIENQSRAIEAAFRESTGDLIFLLDGDDAFLPGKISAYVDAYREDPEHTVMVQAPLEKIDETGHTLGIEFEPARHQTNYFAHIYAENELNVYYPTSALAFSRRYLERQLPLEMNDGFSIWPDARLALVAPLYGRVVALKRPYSQWRRHPRSHTVIKHPSIYRLVRLNQNYFNAYCRAHGFKTISPWRSRYHRRRWLRHYLVPDWAVQWFRRIRWATLSKEHKRRMLAGPDMTQIERELEKLKQQGLETR